jgi:filamentous hemagglutinin family protein
VAAFSLYRVLVGTTALAAATILTPLVAEANPKGGTVVGGQATISQAKGHTTIRQQSKKAIINWKGFDIDQNEVTSFIQPGSKSIALNRIDSNKPSLINGRLEANGHVWVVNPSGVVFGPTAQVDVHGIVATTSDILDSDFMSGNYAFSIPSPDPAAAVINQGNISIGEFGLAALVAPHVRNDGMIVGTLGQIVLAGAPTFTLDLHGDGLIQFAATSEVLNAVDPTHALVENTGTILADGGHVLLTAAAAAGVVNEVINTSGVVEARSVSQDHGEIVLHGGGEGIVTVSGQLNATGVDADTVGGEIDIRGEKVLIAGGAHIDASGHSGGGRVLIGGDPQGGSDGDRAKQTIVVSGATIAADATTVGDGGDVLVWADDGLVYAGSISARGGPEGGDGGTVETSSPGSLAVTGTVDTGAVAGEDGQWLLDPLTVKIADEPGALGVPVFADDPPTGGTATVSVQSINQATGNVVIEATDTIIVEAPLSTLHDITLKAKLVSFERPIQTAGTVTVSAETIKSTDSAVISAKRLNIESLAPSSSAFGGDVDIKTAVNVLAVGQQSSDNRRFAEVIIENKGNLIYDGEVSNEAMAETLHLTVEGSLTLNQPIVTDAEGDAIVLVTDRLINNVGPGALITPNGRYIIYSVNPRNDALNGIPAAIVYSANIENTPPEVLPGVGNVILYQGPGPTEPAPPPEIPALTLTSAEINVITDPIVISPSDLGQSEAVALAAPSPSLFAVPPALDPAGSQDLLFSNDGNQELWGLSGTK